jgi:hypothetical protein
VLAHRAVRERVQAGLAALRAKGGGTSTYATHALLLAEPPSIDAGEITDKGYINQRAVLTRRAAQVEELMGRRPGSSVIGRSHDLSGVPRSRQHRRRAPDGAVIRVLLRWSAHARWLNGPRDLRGPETIPCEHDWTNVSRVRRAVHRRTALGIDVHEPELLLHDHDVAGPRGIETALHLPHQRSAERCPSSGPSA